MPRPRYKPLKTTASEREVQRAIVEAFALFGIDAERQNTGGCTDSRGQYVKFGEPGNSDLHGELPAHFAPDNGKRWMCEVKAEAFDPRKCYGKARERFDRQVAKLRRLNDAGGYGFWANSAEEVIHILTRIKDGCIVRIADDDEVELVEREDRPWPR
jgi:hypothetical protein